MKIALIADIHANAPALQKVLEDLNNRGIQNCLFLGDYILDGFDNKKVLKEVRKNGNIGVIKGNKEAFYDKEPPSNWFTHDQFTNMVYTLEDLTKEDLEYIRSLPQYQILEIGKKKILACHGSPYSCRDKYGDSAYEAFDQLIEEFDFDIFITAHTHVGYHTIYKNHHFINPSSVGMPLDGAGIKYGVLTISAQKVVYEPICLSFEYSLFEKYYKESAFYKKVNTWAKISLMNIKDGYNYTQDFIDRVYGIAKEKKIDTREGIPNSLWNTEYKKFIKERKLKRYIEE